MFKVGDRVLCVDAWHSLQGKEVTVVHCFYGDMVNDWFVDIQTDDGAIIQTLIHSRFKLIEVVDGKSAIERKIRSMYARQYRKTKQACFLGY